MSEALESVASDLGLEVLPTPVAEENKPSVEDMAAHDYQKLIPVFLDKISFLSKKQLNRVIKAVVEYPLENNRPEFSFEAEKQAFFIAMNIFDCKFVLMKHVYETLQRKADSEKVIKELEMANATSSVVAQDSAASETTTNKDENNVN